MSSIPMTSLTPRILIPNSSLAEMEYEVLTAAKAALVESQSLLAFQNMFRFHSAPSTISCPLPLSGESALTRFNWNFRFEGRIQFD
jgi:hypothetical protein